MDHDRGGAYSRPRGPKDRFWLSFGEGTMPSFEGMSVLEIGSGKGLRCIEVASLGARHVVGIDPLADSVAEANDLLARQYPKFRDRVEFRCCRIGDIDDKDFDLVFSEDTFEHIWTCRRFSLPSEQS
jgi:cyclopropane fatty-acyl-phospholipid synthase-like methyltransferase